MEGVAKEGRLRGMLGGGWIGKVEVVALVRWRACMGDWRV